MHLAKYVIFAFSPSSSFSFTFFLFFFLCLRALGAGDIETVLSLSGCKGRVKLAMRVEVDLARRGRCWGPTWLSLARLALVSSALPPSLIFLYFELVLCKNVVSRIKPV